MMRLASSAQDEHGSDGLQGNTDQGIRVWMMDAIPQAERQSEDFGVAETDQNVFHGKHF